jgi:hypothetical protein
MMNHQTEAQVQEQIRRRVHKWKKDQETLTNYLRKTFGMICPREPGSPGWDSVCLSCPARIPGAEEDRQCGCLLNEIEAASGVISDE